MNWISISNYSCITIVPTNRKIWTHISVQCLGFNLNGIVASWVDFSYWSCGDAVIQKAAGAVVVGRFTGLCNGRPGTITGVVIGRPVEYTNVLFKRLFCCIKVEVTVVTWGALTKDVLRARDCLGVLVVNVNGAVKVIVLLAHYVGSEELEWRPIGCGSRLSSWKSSLVRIEIGCGMWGLMGSQ